MTFTTFKNSKILKAIMVTTIAGVLVCAPAGAKNITIKMGNVDSPFKMSLSETNGEFASTDIKCQAFKKIVESASGGRIQVKIFPAGQLGGEREMLEMTKMGSLQMNGCSAAALATFVPEVMAIQIPYIFRDENVALKVLNGPVGAELNELIAQKMGMRIFAWNSEGYYNIGNTKKPIRVPGDLKGLKIRVPETPNMVEIIKLAGGVPTPISFTEVYTTLQQGVVDGAMTGIGLHYTMKTHELIKYYSLAGPWFGWSPIGINEKFYQTLSAEDQTLIKEAALKAMAVHLGMVYWGTDLWVDLFNERGIQVHTPSAEEHGQWVSAIKEPMIEWTKAKIGAQWVDKIMRASEAAEKELYGN
jgi:tripartite ATP-independent transporter DctP family solute receptor